MKKKSGISVLDNVNWPLLRNQKLTLVKVIGVIKTGLCLKGLSKEQVSHLDGLLHLIDHIQDYAVDQMHLSEKTIFGKKFK